MNIQNLMMLCLTLATLGPIHAKTTSDVSHFGVQLELAGRYAFTTPDEGIEQQFVLPRTRATLSADDGRAISGRFVVAAVRSTPETGYIGIDGEALVTRVDAAEARVRWAGLGLSLGAGVLSNPWVDRRNDRWTWQAIAPTVSEAQGFMARADLGFELRWRIPNETITFWVQGQSGEGHRFRERNDGQTVIGVLRVRPLGFVNTAWSRYLEVSVMGQDGSVGAASARNHRFGARIAGGNTRLVGGVEWIKALGRDGDPVPEPWALSAWTETNPWGPFIGYARFDLTDMNPKAQDSYRSVLDVGVGVRMPYADAGPDRQARLSLGYRRARAEAQATPIAGASSQTSTHVVFAQLTLDLGLTFTATAERKK